MRSLSAQRRERERAQLREGILEAAQRILERDGHEAISIRAVADAIEYAPATLYIHFSDKEAILGELGRRGFERLAASMRTIGGDNAIDRLAKLGRIYLDFAVGQPHLYELMFIAKGLRFFDPDSPAMAEGPECFQILLETVKRAQQEGHLRGDVAAQILTYSIWGALHGIASFAVSQRFFWIEPGQLQQLFDTAARAAVAGLTA